ncbi:hypothetical protein DMN91_002701 [Ooceraea biroi]|uniref:Carboxylesterase 5A n=1 Tax=Ooceraea biroi TaxID=2015173 RepID=A0A026VUG0_OOCBI|nr:carboxylesterase 5A [Ooceraea biroi]EZA47111.1 Carboxylesterase 5A [Ooceraea biroi]RLU24612.1 hypothetical protein DMN91_002701 [Ooceraea biroi]
MRRATWLLFASSLLLVRRTLVIRAQRTYARQGVNREAPTVKIPGQGTVFGKEVSLGAQRVTQYLGIPYAQPPIGDLRFARPVTNPLPSWSDVRNATQFAPSCQQVSGRLKLHEEHYKRLLPLDIPNPGFSEDCLFLNIFVPDGNRPDERWPVMVWFHGGDFNTGTPAIWDASIFVIKQKVLVVTVAYRLNILGFFTTTDTEAAGNYGMFDQIAALDWIKQNIKHFNGAPGNIVIYGHNSGAISVGLHMLSPLSRGKFNKAIAMSGDAIGSVGSPETELPVVDLIADKFGCYRRPTSALMECLRRLPADFLVKHSSDIETWGPIVDAQMNNETEPFLSQPPRDILESGNFNAVPLIAGYTNNEQVLAYIEIVGKKSNSELSPESFETMIMEEFSSVVPIPNENSTCESKPEMVTNAVLFYYKPYPPTTNATIFRDKYLNLKTEKNFAAGLTLLASRVANRRSATAFVYRFDYRPKSTAVLKDVPEWAGAPHMSELPYVWGLPYVPGGAVQWQNYDKKTSDTMMGALATFARTGDPSYGNQVKWEPFTQQYPRILIIEQKTIAMNQPDAVDYKALAFWNEYYPQIVEEASNNCCNITSAAGSTWRTLSRGACLSGVVATVTLHHFWF